MTIYLHTLCDARFIDNLELKLPQNIFNGVVAPPPFGQHPVQTQEVFLEGSLPLVAGSVICDGGHIFTFIQWCPLFQ